MCYLQVRINNEELLKTNFFSLDIKAPHQSTFRTIIKKKRKSSKSSVIIRTRQVTAGSLSCSKQPKEIRIYILFNYFESRMLVYLL